MTRRLIPIFALALLATPTLSAQQAPQVHFAPFGRVVREASPYVTIVQEGLDPRSHAQEMRTVEARGMGTNCDEAFLNAIKALSSTAEAGGANGVIKVRSPEAPPSDVPTYICGRGRLGPEVVLTGTAVRLNGSDAPLPRPPARGRPRIASGAPATLPALYPMGPVALAMPVNLSRSDMILFRKAEAPTLLSRKISDVEASGASQESCREALDAAIRALFQEAEKAGGIGLTGVRSPNLENADFYVCEGGPQMTVRLTGVAAGPAISR